MRRFNQTWLAFMVICLTLSASNGVYAQDETTEGLRRKTPSGQYIDPASFFRFHGYVSLSYAHPQAGFGKIPNTAPQILVSSVSPRSGDNEGGFRNDGALFIGGEPFEGVGTIIELHFVGNALDLVLTEAKIVWDLAGRDGGNATFRLMAGRFWWPFGIHNDEWFSAVNRFAVISPAASEVVPAHYNEVGLMAEGELKMSDSAGLNYVFSVGNGVPGFTVPDAVRGTAFDYNSDRALTGRVGLVLQQGGRIELGLSGTRSKLRVGQDVRITDLNNINRYESDFQALGADASLNIRALKLRSYYYTSKEDLSAAPQNQLDRKGFTVEPSITFDFADREIKNLLALELMGRYSQAQEDDLSGGTPKYTQLAAGALFHFTRTLKGRIGYAWHKEKNSATEIDNDIFFFSLTAEF